MSNTLSELFGENANYDTATGILTVNINDVLNVANINETTIANLTPSQIIGAILENLAENSQQNNWSTNSTKGISATRGTKQFVTNRGGAVSQKNFPITVNRYKGDSETSFDADNMI